MMCEETTHETEKIWLEFCYEIMKMWRGFCSVSEPVEVHGIFPVAEPVEALPINLTLRQAQGPEFPFLGG
jgi:hypothetical protein